jgi:hypothetical protein
VRATLAASLLVAIAFPLAGGCGPEDIQLARVDASAPDAGDDGASEVLPGVDGAPPVCDADAPAPACRALGDPCGSSSDCCSTHCTAGVCVANGACAGAGAACASPGDCCSGFCEPTSGPGRACLAACRPAGVACARASDCCALDCNGGVCGGAECKREGSDCASNGECCSNLCDPTQMNKCAIDQTATCRPTGESCNSGGKGTCCGTCDEALDRCDPGAGACRALGVVCSQPSDCCGGACAMDASGVLVCSGAPLADGASCQASFECASGSCGSNPPACSAPPQTSCIPSGSACDDGGACCSGQCAGGVCQSGCIPVTR